VDLVVQAEAQVLEQAVPVWAEQPARAEQLVVQAQAVRAQPARRALAAARPHQVATAQVQVALGVCRRVLFTRERQTILRKG